MALLESETQGLREEIQDLDLNNPDDLEIYREKRREYISVNEEGKRHKDGRTGVYDDSTGKPLEPGQKPKGNATVGIGYNMDRRGARDEWGDAFKSLPEEQRPDFDKVKQGKEKLNQGQIDTLFEHGVSEREKQLENIYGDTWDKLEPNERLAIEDLYYNGGGGLVGKKRNGEDTNFKKNIDEYVKAKERGDTEAANKPLDDAIWETRKNSNAEKLRGIQNRRNSESEMLNTDGRRDDLNKVPTPDYIKKPVEDEAKEKLEESKNKRPSEEDIQQGAEEMAKENEVILTDQIEETCGVTPAFNDSGKVSGMVSSLVADYEQFSGEIFADIQHRVQEAIEKATSEGKTENRLRQAAEHVINQLPGRFERMSDGIIVNFNANLTESRQKEFGITHYIWRTSDDDKVRDHHAHRDDQLFTWDSSDIIPGEEINCRCWAEPTCPDEEAAA